MSAQPNLDKRIDAFFIEGPTMAPDHLLGQTLRAATGERQARRPWWPRALDRGARRDAAFLLVGAGAAVVLAGTILWRGGLFPPVPSPSDEPGASGSTSPSPSAPPRVIFSSPAPTNPQPSPTATPPVTSRIPIPGTTATADVTGWSVIDPTPGIGAAVMAAVLSTEHPALKALGGVPHGVMEGWSWLYRPDAFAQVHVEPLVGGGVATLATAVDRARGIADRDPSRVGDVTVRRLALPAGRARQVTWHTTVDMSGVMRDVINVMTFVDVGDVILRVRGVAVTGGTTSEAELTDLARTLRLP